MPDRLRASTACGVGVALLAAALAASAPRTGAEQLPALAEIPPAAVAPSAPFRALRRLGLGHVDRLVDYVPEPDQGVRHVTRAGTVWWGWGPSTDAPRPTVILLHGAGRSGESMVDMWREVAEREGLVIVAPDLADVPGWGRAAVDPRVLVDALQDAAGRHPVDPSRVALFGHSRGGIAAQIVANRVAGPWRAVAVHAGTAPAIVMQPIEDGVPIRHFIGSHDRTFPYAEAVAAARGIAARGHPFDLVRMERRTHWLYDRGEEIAAEAWAWLADELRAPLPAAGTAPDGPPTRSVRPAPRPN